MSLKHTYLIFYLLVFTGIGYAQEKCASHSYNLKLRKKYPSIAAASAKFEALLVNGNQKNLRKADDIDTIIKIPVVVHVIHSTIKGNKGGFGNNNISDKQIFSQIDVLNEDYRRKPGTSGFNSNPLGADTKIEFCLANQDPGGNSTSGITRHYNEKEYWLSSLEFDFDDSLMKSIVHWPSEKYLNIYVADLAGPIKGYAQYPYDTDLAGIVEPELAANLDGVVLDYEAFGRIGTAKIPYDLGHVATHEIGHWLGLRHIWGDAICGNDYVDDTPPDAGANSNTNCEDSSDCTGTWVQDLTSNYLDYSPDFCRNMFTLGQKARMRHALEVSKMRNSAIHNTVCKIVAGVSPEVNKPDFKIYPNPSRGIFNYEFINMVENNIHLDLFNCIGQKIYSVELNASLQIGDINMLQLKMEFIF